MRLKILSWNIWISGHFDQISDFLKKSNADIIGLQEVKDDDPKRDVIEFLSELGYKHVFVSVKKTWKDKSFTDGPAVFSKYPILKTEAYMLSKTDERAAIKAEIQIEDKKLLVFSTHLIHTHQKDMEVQNEQALNLLKLLPRENTVVMGDFNATPGSFVIKKMREEFTDSDPNSKPTWSVYPEGCLMCKPQDISIRLDYIFTSPDVKIKSSEVEGSKGSDHLPITAEIEI